MEFKFEKIKSAKDNTSLEMMVIEPTQINGIVQMVHGMAEHKERYQWIMQELAKQGYVVAMHDHRGHGSIANEELGHFKDPSGSFIVEDTVQITRLLKKRYPQVPLVLFGHSMGSLVVRCFMKKYDQLVDGLIVCGSPSQNPMASVAILLVKAMILFKGDKYKSKFIDRLAFSSYNKNIHSEYEHAWICSDESVVKEYEASEKCGYLFTLNGYLNLFMLMKETYNLNNWQMKNKNCPILFIAGEEDPCIVNKEQFLKACKSMEKVGYRKVKYKLYPSVRHEILNDVSKEEVKDTIVNFIGEVTNKD